RHLSGTTPPSGTGPNLAPSPPPRGVGSRPIAAPIFAPAAMPTSSGGLPLGGSLPFGLNPLSGIIAPIAMDPGLPAASLLAVVAARRGQPQGPTTEQEVEDFIYDALELLPGAAEVEVRCESGRATLTGTVQHKRVKRDAGEIAWAIPALNDVQNNVTITSRRRARAAGREPDVPASVGSRKQA